jgi:hypothetical protein
MEEDIVVNEVIENEDGTATISMELSSTALKELLSFAVNEILRRSLATSLQTPSEP